MTPELTRCESCGAPMKPQTDGRTRSCSYCGAEVQVAIDSTQIAAGLKLDTSNVDAFLHRLSESLEHGFGDLARVNREGGKVVLIELTLEPDQFVARRERQGVVAQHRRMVRGIALKTVTHPIDKWVVLLTDAIAVHANTSAEAAQALAQLRVR